MIRRTTSYVKPVPVNYSGDNLLSVRDSFLPSGGVWLIGGKGVAPGVNPTFTQGICQTDLDNLRAGKTLYVFSPAHITPSKHNHSVLVPGHWVHASAYAAPFFNDFYRAHPTTSLITINQYAGMNTQAEKQAMNRSFNVDAVIGIATFVGAGVIASGALGGAAAAGDGSVATDSGAVTASNSEIFGTQIQMGTVDASAGAGVSTDIGGALVSGAESVGTGVAKSVVLGKLQSMLTPQQSGQQQQSGQPVIAGNIGQGGQGGGLTFLPILGLMVAAAALLL